MLTLRELATLRAALLFWQEEMCPHDEAIMRPYLESNDIRPLSVEEIEALRSGLLPANVHYALFDTAAQRLAGTELFSSADDILVLAAPGIAIVTVLLALP